MAYTVKTRNINMLKKKPRVFENEKAVNTVPHVHSKKEIYRSPLDPSRKIIKQEHYSTTMQDIL